MVLCLSWTVCWVAAASAAPFEPGRPALALTVTPAHLTLRLDRAGSGRPVLVTNGGRTPVDVTVVRAVVRDGANGVPRFDRDPHRAPDWLAVSPTRFHLDAQAVRRITVRSTVSGAPKPAGYRAALLFSVSQRTGTPGFQNTGAIAVSVSLVDPWMRVIGLDVPHISFGGPVRLSARLRAAQTIGSAASGAGGVLVRVNGRTFGSMGQTLPPGAAGEVTAWWRHPPVVCLCHVTMTVAGRPGASASATRGARVLVLPSPGLLIALLGLVAVSVLVGLIVHRRVAGWLPGPPVTGDGLALVADARGFHDSSQGPAPADSNLAASGVDPPATSADRCRKRSLGRRCS